MMCKNLLYNYNFKNSYKSIEIVHFKILILKFTQLAYYHCDINF